MTTETMTNNFRRAHMAIVAALIVACLLVAANPAHASTTFTVNQSTDVADENLSDNLCDIISAIPGEQCTLRAAIEQANDTDGADTINFNLSGSGVKTIDVGATRLGALPTIIQQVTIDGYSQPGASPNTLAKGTNANILIELNGENLSAGGNYGLTVLAPNSVVRGLAINRFPSFGIYIFGGSAKGVRVEGNFIGTDPSGTIDLGNGTTGVEVQNASANTIGGTTPETRNLISGNGFSGVRIIAAGGSAAELDLAANNKVLGNLIGTKNDGISPLGNSEDGVSITGASDDDIARNNVVGGAMAASANTIAFSEEDGVHIVGDGTSGNRVLRNSIFSNKGLGIELGFDGSTKNDPRDADTGANGLQNKPAIASAITSGGKTTIKGNLSTKPSKTYVVRFFANPSGENEGKLFIGKKKVTTNSESKVSFTFSPAQKVGLGKTVTATATDSVGNTSEFSAPRTVVAQ